MKLAIILLCLFASIENSGYLIINDILYKMPKNEIVRVKTAYHIDRRDVVRFEFDKDSCFTSTVECINVKGMTEEDRESWSQYIVNIPMLFLYEGKLVSKDSFHPSNLKSLTLYPKKEAIQKFGCEGLAPIFRVELKEGKTIKMSQSKKMSNIVKDDNNNKIHQ